MTSRQRAQAAFAHKTPDAPPISLGNTIVDSLSETALHSYEDLIGVPRTSVVSYSGFMSCAPTPEHILARINNDFAGVRLGPPFEDTTKVVEEGIWEDEFQARYRMVGKLREKINTPLSGPITLDDVKKIKGPDPYAPGRADMLRQRAIHLRDADKAIALDILPCSPFETLLMLRGWEDFLCDLYLDRKLAAALLDKMTETCMGFYDVALKEVGDIVDVVCCGDDLGMQDRAILPPEVYEEMVQPHHKRLYGFIKQKAPQAKIFHHSCGSVFPLIPALMEAGVEILQSVQTSAADMDIVKLKQAFGSELIFWGGIDVQKLLPTGTPDEVQSAIHRLVEVLGRDGGFVLSPSHNIQPGTPPENIRAMIDAMAQYRND